MKVYVVYHLEEFEASGPGLRSGTVAKFHKAYLDKDDAKKEAEEPYKMYAEVELDDGKDGIE